MQPNKTTETGKMSQEKLLELLLKLDYSVMVDSAKKMISLVAKDMFLVDMQSTIVESRTGRYIVEVDELQSIFIGNNPKNGTLAIKRVESSTDYTWEHTFTAQQ